MLAPFPAAIIFSGQADIYPGDTIVIPRDLDQLEALDQKISSLNQVKLIYCKVSATKEFLRDNRSNKKGDKVKLDYYFFESD